MRLDGVWESMRSALLSAVVIALVSGSAAARVEATASVPARTAKSAFPPVLGISFRSPPGTLAWFDPLTLKTLRGRKSPLAGHTGNWAFSADRAVIALGGCDPPEIRFVNARTMRVLGDLRLGPYRGCADLLAWLRPDRLLAVSAFGTQPEVAVVDPVARRVIRRELLPSSPWTSGRTRDELVFLHGTEGAFAPARLAVVDPEGVVRVVSIDRVLAGIVVDEESEGPRVRTIQPGLAVDPDGRRAFVVPASGPTAEIDLETLAVSYHELERPSLFARFLRWLTPVAQAKGLSEGPVRAARWLGDGVIAVSGADHAFVRTASGEEHDTTTPAGLSLIDTRSWTTRVLEPQASGFAVAPGLVVAWNDVGPQDVGRGLRAFGLDGRERWRLHDGDNRYLVPAGPVGYVYLGETKAEVVDLSTGHVLATIPRGQSWPQLLAAQSSGW